MVIKPVIAWVTSSTVRTGEILKQLPMTVGEIERDYGKNGNNLPYRDQAY